jgi:ApbE superfamily uncharacterized protein (UPF0280 family)
MTDPAAGWLPGGRLHLQHGPIDLVIEAFGPEAEVAAAYRDAWGAFRPVLDDLVAVLPLLRTPVTELMGGAHFPRSSTEAAPHGAVRAGETAPSHGSGGQRPARGVGAESARPGGAGRALPGRAPGRGHSGSPLPPGIAPGSVAERMLRAAARHAPVFITPMAAVAGAVADHVLAAMVAGHTLERAYVNNGGDAALWLSPGSELVVAGGPALADRIRVTAESPARGVATSGWRGRSHSLGIADAVTVLGRSAAEADAAATLIANAVDLAGHPAVSRRPARELAPDSDLGERRVTVGVGALSAGEVARALAAGRAVATEMRRDGLILAAALWLAGECVTVGDDLAPGAAAPAGQT